MIPEYRKMVERATYEVLDEIGLPYKKVTEYDFVNSEGGLCWQQKDEASGKITICLGAEAGGVAHELGHGFHEALNHNKKAVLPYPFRYDPDPNNDDDGEAVAEAIRFFVEARLGTGWRPNQNLHVLAHCNYNLAKFRAMVRALVLS